MSMAEGKQGLFVFVVSMSLGLTHEEIQGRLKTGKQLQPTVGQNQKPRIRKTDIND